MPNDLYYNQLQVLEIGCSTLGLAITKKTNLIKLNYKMYCAETKIMILYIMNILSVGFYLFFLNRQPL